MFVRNPELLKRLVAGMLNIQIENIADFIITNPDIPPEVMGDKFCRLDINMKVDDRKVDLEVQVANEGDYPERSLYYWAREYSSALSEGEEYIDLPCTIIINILSFKQFVCSEFYSEYQALEVTRYTPLTDKFCIKFYELPKLPEVTNADDELKLWLMLFSSKTEEDLKKIEAMGVPIMKQVIGAYRAVTANAEFKEIERLRSRARHNEASALGYARRKGEKAKAVVIAKNLLKLGDTVEKIVMVTGLTHEEVEQLSDIV